MRHCPINSRASLADPKADVVSASAAREQATAIRSQMNVSVRHGEIGHLSLIHI